MLFELSENLIESLDKLENREKEAVERIVANYIIGKHHLTSTLKGLEVLSKWSFLSQNQRNHLRELRYKAPTEKGRFKELKVIIKVCVSYNELTLNPLKEKIEYGISPKMLLEGEYLEQSRLLSEDLKDVLFYKEITEFCHKKDLRQFGFSLDELHSNGSGTASYLKHLLEKKQLIITVVDSDKKNHGSPLGETAKQAEKAYKQHKENTISEFKILPVREKENLLSANILGVYGCEKFIVETLEIVENEVKNRNIIRYLDLKNGLHSQNFLEEHQEILENKKVIEHLSKANNDNSFTYFKGNIEEFTNKLPIYLIGPLGNKTLEDFSIYKKIKHCESYIEQLSNNTNAFEKYTKEKRLLENFMDNLLPFARDYLSDLSSCIFAFGFTRKADSFSKQMSEN